jgi:hypothetical protein
VKLPPIDQKLALVTLQTPDAANASADESQRGAMIADHTEILVHSTTAMHSEPCSELAATVLVGVSPDASDAVQRILESLRWSQWAW